MLQQFTVGNYASFKSRMTLSLEASSDTENEEANIIRIGDKRLLKSAVVYGANASGKSNLISAIGFMRMFVLTSSRESQIEEEIEVEPFRLSTDCDNQPSYFEIIFFQDGTRFRYGFEVDNKRVHSEWLFSSSSSREAELFTREGGKIDFNPDRFKEGRSLVDKTRPNALFLSVVAQFNGEISSRVVSWFIAFFSVSATRNPPIRQTVERLADASFASRVLAMSRVADLGIEGLIPKTHTPDDAYPQSSPSPVRRPLYSLRRQVELKTQHKKYDSNNQPTLPLIEFDFERNESDGTKKYLAMTGPLIAALDNGTPLVVDELDARLHPLLSRTVVSLFNNPNCKKNAQLIFATHDTNLLNRQLFRRDQVWFTEKDSFGATNLYSLSEFRVRKDASFGKDYILGKFGAIPFIGDADSFYRDAKTMDQE
jgi:AAA15 family ATPase/GTPase